MLKWLVMAAMTALGYGVLYLVNGQEGMTMRARFGKNNLFPALGYSILLIIWAFCLMFLFTGSAAGDTFLCIVIAVLVPVIIFLIARKTRKRVKNILEQEKNGLLGEKTKIPTPDGGWKCARCGTIHLGSDKSCSCWGKEINTPTMNEPNNEDKKEAVEPAVEEKADIEDTPKTDKSVNEQLFQLKSLKDAGIITQEEFDAKKKQILGL